MVSLEYKLQGLVMIGEAARSHDASFNQTCVCSETLHRKCLVEKVCESGTGYLTYWADLYNVKQTYDGIFIVNLKTKSFALGRTLNAPIYLFTIHMFFDVFIWAPCCCGWRSAILTKGYQC